MHELERAKANSVDLVARSDAIVAKPKAETVVLDISGQEFPMNRYAHGQLAEKMGIPAKYYDRMLASGKRQLLADNINAWMDTKERRLIRVLDGNVRAILSDRYRPIDNYDLVWSFLDAIKEYKANDGIAIQSCDLTETRMYIRAMLPAISEIVANDKVQAMLLLQNSEVGAGRMTVCLGFYRQICSNGLWGDDIVDRVHLGSRLDEGLVQWSEQTLKDNDIALFDQVKDTVRTALDTTLWGDFVCKTQRLAGAYLDKPMVEIVDGLAPKLGMSVAEKDRLLEMFAIEASTPAGKTAWGFANAVTRLAQSATDADRQVELEKIGGTLVENIDEFRPYMVKAVA